MTNIIVREFCHNHGINVVNSNKRAYRHTKLNTQLFAYPDDYNKFLNEHITFETETLYTVEISESELERMAEFEAQVFNNLKETGHYRMFEVLMEQKEHEKFLKEKYPAVKKAYEHYSLILKLAESGEI
jgi:hypothetical protein